MHRRALFACATPLLLLCAQGCSSSDASSAPSDTGSVEDTAAIGDASSDSTSSSDADAVVDSGPSIDANDPAACGAPPYVTFTGSITEYGSSPKKPIAGAKVTLDACAGKTFTTDASGHALIYVSRGVSTYFRVEATGYITMSGPDFTLDADFDDPDDWLLPSSFESILADWSASTPTMLVLVLPTASATGACAARDGVTISVPGHPEAKVTYYDPGAIPTPSTTLTATSTSGVATISGLAGGITVEPAATKSGCTATFKDAVHSGKYPLENGVLSRGGVFMQ